MKPPILIAGLPRTGTTWIASILGATAGTAYYHEPFNFKNVPESARFSLRYVAAEDQDPAFADYCRTCFSGQQRHPNVIAQQSRWRRFLPFPTGRVLIKDVHSLLALDWIQHHIAPRIVIVLRHPFAVADSWSRHGWNSERLFARLLEQTALLDGCLKPFESHLHASKADPFGRLGAYWAACYHVVLDQQRQHPEWIVIRHEDFLESPEERFGALCAQLDLPWNHTAKDRLWRSNEGDSSEPFAIRRSLDSEKEKWRRHLTRAQIEALTSAIAPFRIQSYSLE